MIQAESLPLPRKQAFGGFPEGKELFFMKKAAFVLSIVSVSLSVITVFIAAALFLRQKVVYIDSGC